VSTISADNIGYAYPGGESVLDGVSLDVGPGEFVGIVGPNGSGKSTLLRLLAGLLSPASGEVSFDKKSLAGMHRIEIARVIGYLPQAVGSSFRFSVEEVVLMGRYPHLGALGFESDADRKIAQRALDATGTEKFAKRDFEELSGGERQRVLVASIIAQEPKVFLLDEPTAALDVHHQVAVYELLHSQASGGAGVAVVTHDLNLASQFCDRLLLLVNGGIAATGTPQEVVTAENINEIYGSEVLVTSNPQTGTPAVLPVRGEGKDGTAGGGVKS
jgi:iron complex transport system ATP-binding protein